MYVFKNIHDIFDSLFSLISMSFAYFFLKNSMVLSHESVCICAFPSNVPPVAKTSLGANLTLAVTPTGIIYGKGNECPAFS